MTEFKIMNVLLSDEPQFLGAPTMLCRSTAPWIRGEEEGSWLLRGPAAHDFTTFFNALSLQKWKLYTVAREFHVHLELKGAACIVAQTRADSYSYYSEHIDGTEIQIAASEKWQAIDFTLVAQDLDVIEAFAIEAQGDVLLRNGYYYAVVDDDAIRPVELALCTTTFKKEEYITRNIGLVRSQVLGSDDLVARHFTMHVVDNGRTLDAGALTGGGVVVHPNPNAGGAGGFARGMIEAMAQEPRATHVLLMDDDVLIAPESIIRTFNLLSLVNEEYRDAFISGAMMNMDEPNMRWEEMGFVGRDGAFHPLKPVARMEVLHDVVNNETFDIPSYMPNCEDQDQHYAAWWYCVIPMSQIVKNGLPVPVFVRGDDVEYSRRCKPKFITMSSICIWHLSFHMRYNAAQERYQMTRNCLIDQYASDFAPLSDFEAQIRGAFHDEMERFNYKDAELVLKGMEDFLKGPEWIMQPVAQEAFMAANRESEKLQPLEEIKDELESLGIDVPAQTEWALGRDLPVSAVDGKLLAATYNGQKLHKNFLEPGKVAVVYHAPWSELRGRYQKAEVIVAIDTVGRKGVIRRRDPERFKALVKRYQADMKELNDRKDELKAAWLEAFPQMTSVEFWKGYLGIA